jgi:hypothetical protein
MDVLEQELREAKQQHQDVTAQTLANFFTQVDAAMASSDAALALYQQAGGAPPDPVPVATLYASETASEKKARQALDAANLATMANALELQCGLMHYAALFVVSPEQKGLQAEWVAWLNRAAQIYPQLAVPTPVPAPIADPGKPVSGVAALVRPPPFDPSGLEGIAVSDSVIGKYLGFKTWDDKDPGRWSVHDLPGLFRTNVLDPLRVSPTAATLDAWDVYIAMLSSDEKDSAKWNDEIYPPLQFERLADGYAVAPSTEKLEGLVNLIKAHPTDPKADDWISRVHQLMEAYRARHATGEKTAENSTPPTSVVTTANPNVTVTTTTQGDMTIVTTHTNSAPTPKGP